MQRRFSVYMDMLESKGLGEMRRTTKSNFSYKLQEQEFLSRKQAEAQGAYRDPNFGKASGTTVAPPEANQVKKPVKKRPRTKQSTLNALQQRNNELEQRNANATDGQVDGTDLAVQQQLNNIEIKNPEYLQKELEPQNNPEVQAALNAQPTAEQPAAEAPAQPAPAQPAPAQPAPAQPAPAQPGKMDKFLSGVNKAGEKIGNFQDRAKAFSQRTGGQGAKGDLSKLMRYGMFGQESLDKPAQIENLKQQFIQQGYPEAEAVKMATNTVNQQPVDNQRQLNKKEQADTLKQMYINNGYSEADAEKMAAREQAKRGTPQDQEGVSTTGDTQSGVKVGDNQQTGVQTNTPTKTNDTLDQAAIDTIDPNELERIKNIPDGYDLDGAVQAVADSNKVDAVALRKYIDAQREAMPLSNTQQ